MNDTRTVIIICGPTAVGKTSAAIQLAQHFKTEIISADSRQCYKELNIGVAKPSVEQLNAVHHYFINSHTIDDEINVGVYEKYALASAEEIFKHNEVAVMVGGTGLYIKAFVEGIDEIPLPTDEIRNEVNDKYQKEGMRWLQEQVQIQDPVFWKIAEQQNPHRLLRALEIKLSTGKSITEFRKGNKVERPFDVIKIGLELPKEELHNNIYTRVDQMIDEGLLHEVKQLLPYKNNKALQTVGYKELFEYLDGIVSLDQAIINIKTNTRQYAKRQMTWFKKDKEVQWHTVGQNILNELLLTINNK